MNNALPNGESEADDPIVGDDDLDAGELSLAELSEAYASVLKQNDPADGGRAEDELAVGDNDDETQTEATPHPRPVKTIQQMDEEDNAPCPISPKSIIESLLFVGAPAGVQLTLKKMAAIMRDVSPKELKKTIKELNKEYQQQNSAFRIVDEKGHYKMQLCDDLLPVQNYFFGRNKAAKLSQGAIDVLAVVAYHQPVSKNQVDAIRKKPSGSVIGQLAKRDLIAVVEGESASKEKLYVTTDRFLKLFDLESLEDLPQTSVVSDLEELTDY